jgi:xanthine dehydrogenase YagT iron-sulfur-binding subunit
MSASGNKPFACDPIADSSEAPNDGSVHMYATRSGESPWSILPLKLDPEQTEEFEELERHGLLTEICRRRFIQATSAVAASMAFGMPSRIEADETANSRPLTLKVNGQPQTLSLDPRTSRLDFYDHGQCGACTAATGRIVNRSLAEYHVPVNADVGVLDVSVIGIPDLKVQPDRSARQR